MRTFHGVRQLNNIVHNAEPVDLHEPWAFLFQYTWLFDAYNQGNIVGVLHGLSVLLLE